MLLSIQYVGKHCNAVQRMARDVVHWHMAQAVCIYVCPRPRNVPLPKRHHWARCTVVGVDSLLVLSSVFVSVGGVLSKGLLHGGKPESDDGSFEHSSDDTGGGLWAWACGLLWPTTLKTRAARTAIISAARNSYMFLASSRFTNEWIWIW